MGALRTFGVSVLLAALLVAVLSAASPLNAKAEAARGSARPSAGLPTTAGPSAPAPALPPSAAPAQSRRDRAAEAKDLKRANVVLAKLQKRYRYLRGVTLRVDPTPQDSQAVAYYTDGEIVISPDHVATIDKILAHEVWHIIDWRDNGQLDWGEDLPPSNASDYRLK